ncbi:MAG: hypothetical protein GY862_30090, partial [Gammaproteobacteria bacterium]|nr:hypothetical protein [Gammaproteobacteria bacterium]
MFQGFTNRPAGEKTISAAALQDILRLLRPIFFHPDSNVLNLPPEDALRPEQVNGTQSMQRRVVARSLDEKRENSIQPPEDALRPEQGDGTQSMQRHVATRSVATRGKKVRETFINKGAPFSTAIDKIPLDLSFSEADELYIGNAGLVILWPFLSRFFTRLDLLLEDNKRFKNPAAMQRAIGLLQYTATGDTA